MSNFKINWLVNKIMESDREIDMNSERLFKK